MDPPTHRYDFNCQFKTESIIPSNADPTTCGCASAEQVIPPAFTCSSVTSLAIKWLTDNFYIRCVKWPFRSPGSWVTRAVRSAILLILSDPRTGNMLITLSREHSVAGNWLSRACPTQTCFRGALTSKKRVCLKIHILHSGGCHSGSSSCYQTTGWSSYRKSPKKTTKKTLKRATKKTLKMTQMKVLVRACWIGFRDQGWRCL